MFLRHDIDIVFGELRILLYRSHGICMIVIAWCDSKINLYAHEAFFEKDENIPKKFSLIKLKKTKNRTAQDEWNPPL